TWEVIGKKGEVSIVLLAQLPSKSKIQNLHPVRSHPCRVSHPGRKSKIMRRPRILSPGLESRLQPVQKSKIEIRNSKICACLPPPTTASLTTTVLSSPSPTSPTAIGPNSSPTRLLNSPPATSPTPKASASPC